MKPHYMLVALSFSCPALLPAQETAPIPSTTPAPAVALEALTPEQLDQLCGPIALYPDALVALILPASTEPSDIVLAARFLNAKSDPKLIDAQPWDESVRSLARYPDVIKWLDENLSWTRQMGAAFADQPADVMKSIQRLRTKARAAGTLKSTAQQEVVVEDDGIRIIPAQPDVIYVPRYDPEVVYVERRTYYPDPFITFGIGFPIGTWLSYDCDWRHRRIWVADRRDRDWHHRRDWRRPDFPDRPGYVSGPHAPHWRPLPDRPRDPRWGNRPRPSFANPRPIDGAPGKPSGWTRDGRNSTPGNARPNTPDYRHGGNRTRIDDNRFATVRPAPAVQGTIVDQPSRPEQRPRLNNGGRSNEGRNWNSTTPAARGGQPAQVMGPTMPNHTPTPAPSVPAFRPPAQVERRPDYRHGGGARESYTPPPAPAARTMEAPRAVEPMRAPAPAPTPAPAPAPAQNSDSNQSAPNRPASYRH